MRLFAHIEACAPPNLAGRVRAQQPDVEILENALFAPKTPGVPFEKDSGWGLYHQDGRLCRSAAYRRGVNGDLVGQSSTIDTTGVDILEAPDILYVYAGVCHVHFGHMVLGTLCRLWSSLRSAQNIKFVLHGDADPQIWFKHPHFRDIMHAAGFDESSFLNPQVHLRLPRVIVPSPSFEESGFVHHAFAAMGARIGTALLSGTPLARAGQDVWLSKARLPWGIQRIVNEEAFDEELARLGVQVLYPETMSIAEQVSTIEACRTLMGSMGSALHATAFSRKPVRIRALAPPGGGVVENYSLMDAAKQNDALYFHLSELTRVESRSAFSAEYAFRNPRKSARMFLDAAL